MDDALERRWRLTHRALPLAGLAAVSLLAGLGFGSLHGRTTERVAGEFADAWSAGDYAAMHQLIAPRIRSRVSRGDLAATYMRATRTATAVAVQTGKPSDAGGGEVRVPVTVRTRVFGEIEGEVTLAVRADETVDWAPHLVFPGLDPGEDLTRRTQVPERAPILSRDGEVLVEGLSEERVSPPEGVGASIAGTTAPTVDPQERQMLYARGFPPDTPVGANGLERAFQRRVEGRPGGALLAGLEMLAGAQPRAAKPVRSTIDTDVQAVAVAALAGRLGGIAVLDPRTAEIRALAGVAFSAPQPPGSTFKLVTTTAALDDELVKPSDEFEVVSSALIDGVELENANGEFCGGTFSASFAHSCNSVFAPLGVEVGAERLVETAERFGWNEDPGIVGALESTLPQAGEMASVLEVGSSAIGQGRVLATPLQMASVAQTIANGGVRVKPALIAGAPRRSRRVTSARTARTIRRLMVGVVDYGTGVAAAIPDVKVAGKTGTAELEDTRGPDAVESDGTNTDAWFTSFAPAGRPRVVVAALFVRNGAGGTVAAPAAQQVLVAGLKAERQ